MANATAEGLKEKMVARGISEDAIKVVDKAIDAWVDSFHHPMQNVENVVNELRSNPFIPKDIPIHGLVINPNDGHLELLVNGYDQIEKK
jgi:carbonic anhydrase